MTGHAAASRVLAFVRLGRPHFLVGGFVLYGVGAAMARLEGHALDLRAYAWGQAAITSTQLMTHYANDYFDLEADRANTTPTRWSGGSRVLTSGLLPPRVALYAALTLAALAVGVDMTIALSLQAPLLVIALLVGALVLSWGYSAPPLRLHARGLGAFTTAAVVAMLTPLLGFAMQAHDVSLRAVLAVLPLVLAQFAMILVIDFPDAEGDRVAGKRTLVVRLGGRAAARLCMAAIALTYAALPVLAVAGVPIVVLGCAALTLPLGALLAWRIGGGAWKSPDAWPGMTSLGVVWFAALATGELLGLLGLVATHT